MKKFYLLLSLLLVMFFLLVSATNVSAQSAQDLCVDPEATGFVPCGVSYSGKIYDYTIIVANSYDVLSILRKSYQGSVIAKNRDDALKQVIEECKKIPNSNCTCEIKDYNSCRNGGYTVSENPSRKIMSCPCQLGHFFLMLLKIYDFIVWNIAVSLAGLFIVIGGVLWLVSGGNQKLIDLGKNILKYSVLGLLLVFSSWLIIDVVLKAIGYTLPWSRF